MGGELRRKLVAAGSGRKVLVVEDDWDAAQALVLVLEGEGYEVRVAGGAPEGLRKVREERPDIVLLDIMMPSGTEGFQFVWELRKDEDEGVRGTPIVVLTAVHGTTRLRFYPEQSDTSYGPGEYLPVQGFLDKPASSADLLAKIEEVLGGTKEEGEGG